MKDVNETYDTWLSKYGSYAKDMTLRDYFAAKALGSCGFTIKPYNTTTETAEKCYAMADAMLKAREQ